MGPRATIGRCKSCGATIFWTVTEAGKRMPCNLVAAEKGNLVVDFSTDPPTSRHATKLEAWPVVARYVSHFATCPTAEKHRKRKVRSFYG
jgi:hypothetical protein